MTRVLTSERRGPSSGGKATSAVVFVHGYGADGSDLLGLADPLGPHLPNTVFFAPDAPEQSVANPFGYQWFPIPWIDGSSEEQARAGLLAAADDFNAFLDGILEKEGLTPDALALVGFSQGTMLSLHVAPRRAQPVGALVGFSGRLLAPELLGAETISRPPVLLVHGDQDDVVPVASMPEAADALVAEGFETYSHISKGTAHGIAHDGLSLALSFLRDKLPG
ncbi:alpha/beta hydrolase [Roseibaca sp. Y0-43]|uniref:alpha/beta hydrolase n=1 Tax=Roseibaca sp. Y0-43 TaxID=2816854 RepID=UPI001D0CB9C5|nr:dienelactone hydrolase family protein [Roseibaca sp. Y0-43]MCC1480595.1 dienelactone hydrolase family protein [Roseibaca sp. Y0-43]